MRSIPGALGVQSLDASALQGTKPPCAVVAIRDVKRMPAHTKQRKQRREGEEGSAGPGHSGCARPQARSHSPYGECTPRNERWAEMTMHAGRCEPQGRPRKRKSRPKGRSKNTPCCTAGVTALAQTRQPSVPLWGMIQALTGSAPPENQGLSKSPARLQAGS